MEEGPSKSQHGTLERRKLERVAGAIESDERDDAFRVEKDHLLGNVASHRLSDQDRLPVAHDIEQGHKILDGFTHRERHSHGLRLAVAAHIPGKNAVMLADHRYLRVKGVVIDQRTVGEDNQGMIFLACEPVVQWTAFPLQNGGLDFFFCLHYWFLSPLISSNTYSCNSPVYTLTRSLIQAWTCTQIREESVLPQEGEEFSCKTGCLSTLSTRLHLPKRPSSRMVQPSFHLHEVVLRSYSLVRVQARTRLALIATPCRLT